MKFLNFVRTVVLVLTCIAVGFAIAITLTVVYAISAARSIK
jgi:hypothetical protein